MNTYTKLYWLTRLDGINALLITIAVIMVVAAIAIVIGILMSKDFDEFHHGEDLAARLKSRKKIENKLRWIIPLGLFCAVASILIPTKNEVIFIVAGGKTIDWAKSDTSIGKIPSQTTAIITQFLDKQIKEMNKGHKKDSIN